MPRGVKPKGQSERENAVRKARAKKEAEKAKLPKGALDLADKLARCMELRGMNQSSLARVVAELFDQGLVWERIHQTRISKWLKRSGEPNHAQTHALAMAMRVPLMYLANPLRVEAPDPREMEIEMDLTGAIERIGRRAALDRVQLAPRVEILGTTPKDQEKTYGAEKERAARRPKVAGGDDSKK